MKISRATPVLFVDRVEPTRDFFTKLGFTVLFDVPEGDRLGFVGLEKDGVQVMVETRGNANEGEAIREFTRNSPPSRQNVSASRASRSKREMQTASCGSVR